MGMAALFMSHLPFSWAGLRVSLCFCTFNFFKKWSNQQKPVFNLLVASIVLPHFCHQFHALPHFYFSLLGFFFFPVSTRICFFRSMQGFGFSFSVSRISHQLPHVHDVFTVSETSELGVYRFISFRVLLVTPFISLPHLLFWLG